MRYDIITFGSATYDMFLASREFAAVDDERFVAKRGLCVPLDSKMRVEKAFFSMGGCGTNTAVTFSRQGLKAAYCGAVGQDEFGKIVESTLKDHGVDVALLGRSKKNPTAFSVILSLPEVGRTILEKYGACHELSEKDIPFDKFDTGWFYIASLSGKSHKMLVPLVEYARKKGVKIAANPAGSMKNKEHTEILKTVLDKIDILILNQEEVAILTGIDYTQEKEVFDKLDEWVNGIVVMTKGPAGVVASDGKIFYSAGIPASEMVDRTGAGDAFGAAFVSGYLETEDIGYAIQKGTANATAVLQEMGATNGLLKKGEWGPWPKVVVNKSDV